MSTSSARAAGRLVDPFRPYWALSVYPDAGEAGGCLRNPRRGGRDVAAEASDPDRAASEAARRARGKVRRYCAANRLNRLGTLTYAGEGCHDPAQLRRDVAGFFRGLRRGLDDKRLPYLWVGEPHPGGHGLHVHFAVGRFVKHGLIKETWGRGHVHIKRLGDLPVGSGPLEEARLAARYLGKYVAKSLDDEARPAGLHRYEVAQGFQPRKVECRGRTADEAIRQASRVMGRAPAEVWRSPEEGWDGPPSCWVSWSS